MISRGSIKFRIFEMVKIIFQMSSTIKSNVWKWDVEPEWNRLSENWLSETASYPWADTAQRSSLWWYYCSNTLQHYRICSALIPSIYFRMGPFHNLKADQAISRSSDQKNKIKLEKVMSRLFLNENGVNLYWQITFNFEKISKINNNAKLQNLYGFSQIYDCRYFSLIDQSVNNFGNHIYY